MHILISLNISAQWIFGPRSHSGGAEQQSQLMDVCNQDKPEKSVLPSRSRQHSHQGCSSVTYTHIHTHTHTLSLFLSFFSFFLFLSLSQCTMLPTMPICVGWPSWSRFGRRRNLLVSSKQSLRPSGSNSCILRSSLTSRHIIPQTLRQKQFNQTLSSISKAQPPMTLSCRKKSKTTWSLFGRVTGTIMEVCLWWMVVWYMGGNRTKSTTTINTGAKLISMVVAVVCFIHNSLDCRITARDVLSRLCLEKLNQPNLENAATVQFPMVWELPIFGVFF